MEAFNKVVPGKVVNDGITSGENLTQKVPQPTYPAHFPDMAAVTPKGPIGRVNVSPGTFAVQFGDVFNPFGDYYNPVTFAIQSMGRGGQSAIGFKRLVNNDANARVILGVTVFGEAETTVPNYERDINGDYVLGDDGLPKVDETTATVKGVYVAPGLAKVSADVKPGKTGILDIPAQSSHPVLPAGLAGKFYPLIEFISGIGDSYNSSYAAMGHSYNTDWNEISRFITENGVYPFTLNIGELLETGSRVAARTTSGTPDVVMTMFETVTSDNVIYSPKNAIKYFTGQEVNRPVQARPAPFEDIYVYQNNINTVGEILYKAEYVTGAKTPPHVKTKRTPKYAIMNMLTMVDHYGKPYHHIVYPGAITVEDKVKGTRVGLNSYMQASGGINPFADNSGNLPPKPSSWVENVDGKWETALTEDTVLSRKQCWEMNQILYLAWLNEYKDSLNFKDVIRNRTSFIWDLGFNQAVKLKLIEFMAARKDFIFIADATEWLRNKTREECYSTRSMLVSRIRMIPESETFKSQACRSSINLWDAKYVDEPTHEKFSLNIDLMYAFALAGGSGDGKIYKNYMPDHEGNRILRIAHSPSTEFEDDDPAAANLADGAISVTPINTAQFCRPALPTVYEEMDSVLKDLPNVWSCVCVEKVLQDCWIQVSGDSQIGKEGYQSGVKDSAERIIRNLYGSVISQWEVETSFREDGPNSKSMMYSKTRLWFGKGVYMMRSVLEAHNEETLGDS